LAKPSLEADKKGQAKEPNNPKAKKLSQLLTENAEKALNTEGQTKRRGRPPKPTSRL